jgi:Hypervirulence associated proteins TUDOR domain
LTNHFKTGDTVQWNTSQGTTTGKVKQKLTSPTDINGHHVAASEDNPQYLVESDKTGQQAAHKPESLQKIEEN